MTKLMGKMHKIQISTDFNMNLGMFEPLEILSSVFLCICYQIILNLNTHSLCVAVCVILQLAVAINYKKYPKQET